MYFILMLSSGNYVSTTINTIEPGYAADIAKIESGDKILKINNENIRLKTDMDKMMQKANGEEMFFTIQRGETIQNISLLPTPEETKVIGIYLGAEGNDLSNEIKSVYQNSQAEQSGLKVGDKIISVNGENVNNDPYKIVQLISESNTNEIAIEVERENETITFNVIPDIERSYKIGITLKEAEDTFANRLYYGYWDTIGFLEEVINNVKMIFTGNININQLTGPIGISEVVSKTQGIVEFIYILAIVSLSLGVTNLLPFPPLDGGKLLILIIEAIRRKPVKENIQVAIQSVGLFLLMGLSIYVAYNDILRIF